MSSDGLGSYDYAKAWESGDPFRYIKSSLYADAILRDELLPEYPNEEIFNCIATKVLVADAFRTKRNISINYNWEPLDENIVIYSISGKVINPELSINDEELGFAIDSPLDDSVMVFPYRKVFWLEESQ
jgi:hypothetical protein